MVVDVKQTSIGAVANQHSEPRPRAFWQRSLSSLLIATLLASESSIGLFVGASYAGPVTFNAHDLNLGTLSGTTPAVTLGAGQSWAQPGSVTLQGTTPTNNQGSLQFVSLAF